MNIQLKDLINTVVFDIETAQEYKTLLHAPKQIREAWINTCESRGWEDVEQAYLDKGALFAEFSKVTAIAMAYASVGENEVFQIKSNSYSSDNELEVIEWFTKHKVIVGSKYRLGGHNISKFDIPFLNKRCIVHNTPIPSKLVIYGVKPWDINYVDTNLMWCQGVYGANVSLNNLCAALSVPSPKNDVSGKDAPLLYHEGKYEDLANYCEGDTRSNLMCLIKMYNSNAKIQL